MASRGGESGINLISTTYSDDDDEMGDVDHQEPPIENVNDNNDTINTEVDVVDSTYDETPPALHDDSIRKLPRKSRPPQQFPQVSLPSPPPQQPVLSESSGSRMQRLTIVDYGHDEVAMSPEAEVLLGAFGLSNILFKSEGAHQNAGDNSELRDPIQQKKRLEGFYEEHPIVKEIFIESAISVSVRKCPDTAKNILFLETDVPGDVVLHWGLCKDDGKSWEIPAEPYPDETIAFKDKALRTPLKRKEDGCGGWRLLTLDEGYVGFLFVLKLDENTWLKRMGRDFFYVPLSAQSGNFQTEGQIQEEINQAVSPAATDGLINGIRNLVSDITSHKSRKTKTKEDQESILQEIEKLAAEAYIIFRSSIPTFTANAVETEVLHESPPKMLSGTGSGYEILCQGFNWESHKSGRWYVELREKATEIASLGFTVVWLPPPTDSVSPEGRVHAKGFL